jgi:MYXO-CTERM domain-containing protein
MRHKGTRLVASIGLLAGLTLGATAQAAALYFDFNRNLVSAQGQLFLFGNAGQAVTVSSLSGFNESVNLNAQGFATVVVPNANTQSGTGIRNTGFQAVSSDPLAGYFINRGASSTDMTYLLDGNALGTRYVVASAGGGFGEGSQVAIQATQDDTQVTFTPKGGAPITVTLNAGQTYKHAGGATDLTGSLVVSDKPVAVSSGHSCAQVPVGTTFCDTLLEQAIPTDRLSTSYLLTASQGAALSVPRADIVRVVATEANTTVMRDGVMLATLANVGDFAEFGLAQNSGTQITADKAVAVAQYLAGGNGANTDPAFSYVPGQDTWLSSYRLATPAGAFAFDVNYASIVIETLALETLSLDGAFVDTVGFSVITGTGFSRGNVSLAQGLFTMAAANPFLVMLGGGAGADSYFTYGGATFAPGISPPPPNGVPTPGTLALAGLGLLGIAAMRRRRAP